MCRGDDMKKQFTPEEIRNIVEVGGANYVEGIGNWLNGQGDYIVTNERTSNSSIMIYLKDLTVKKVIKECKRKSKEFKNHGKRSVFKTARNVFICIGSFGRTLWGSLGMAFEKVFGSNEIKN